MGNHEIKNMNKLILRIPPELKKALLHASIDNTRSLNNEIIHRLKLSFGNDEADTHRRTE